jgi:hypothetical protein
MIGGLGEIMETTGLESLIALLIAVVLWLGELWLFRQLTRRHQDVESRAPAHRAPRLLARPWRAATPADRPARSGGLSPRGTPTSGVRTNPSESTAPTLSA